MTPVQLNQRCWNHEAREAACRCPACGRSYCRECVSEHDGRLLCAACLSALTVRRVEETGGLRRLAPPAMIAAGILLAWLIYWAAGVGLIGFLHRLENTGAVLQRPSALCPASRHDGQAKACPTRERTFHA